MITTNFRPRATAPESRTSTHRGAFARSAALAAFGQKAVHHLSDPTSESGVPDEMFDGREVVARWLDLADNLKGEEAEVARQTADEIRRVLKLSWTDVTGRTAA